MGGRLPNAPHFLPNKPRSKRATRHYLMMVVHQINTTYETACFDACAVMLRRLVESLIIEAFEAKGFDHEIKGPDTYRKPSGKAPVIDPVDEPPCRFGGWEWGHGSYLLGA